MSVQRRMSMKELHAAARQIADWIEWGGEAISLFHHYAHTYGASPGENVYLFVLEEALRSHGVTLAQFKARQVAVEDAARQSGPAGGRG